MQSGRHIPGTERHRSGAEIRDIERFQIVIVERRRFLREEERLRNRAIGIYMHEIRFPIESVVPFACEYEPSARRRPTVISVAHRTVHHTQAVCLSPIKIEHPEIRLPMPYWECSVRGHGVKQTFPVRRHSRMTDTSFPCIPFTTESADAENFPVLGSKPMRQRL